MTGPSMGPRARRSLGLGAAALACLALAPALPIAPATAAAACIDDTSLVATAASHTALPAGAQLTTYVSADRAVTGTSWPVQLTVVTANIARVLPRVFSQKVGNVAPLSSQLRPTGLVAGINGDFFDYSDYGMLERGITVTAGRIVYGPSGSHLELTVDRAGHFHATAAHITGTATFTWYTGTAPKRLKHTLIAPVTAVNSGLPPTGNGVTLYTTDWAAYARPIGTREFTVNSLNKVSAIARPQWYDTPGTPAAGTRVIATSSSAGTRLAAVPRGATVAVSTAVVADDKSAVVSAIGRGSTELMAGRDVRPCGTEINRPRTTIAWDQTGRVWLAGTTSGGPDSGGLRMGGSTTRQIALWLSKLGATDAVALDGGGSTTVIVPTSAGGLARVDLPSTAFQRPVPNGIEFLVR